VNFLAKEHVFLRAMKNHRTLAVSLFSFAVLLSTVRPTQAQTQSTTQPTMQSAEQPKASTVTTETESGFTVVGLWVRTTNAKEAGGAGLIPQLWQRVMEEGLVENVPHRVDNNLTVVYTNYSSDQNGEYTYVLGVRVSSVDKVPDEMMAVNVPAGKYAVVESEQGALPDVLPKVWQRIHAMSETELGGQRAFKADFEVYQEGFDWQSAQIPVFLGLKK
jgi:predicted transcriptional regulator YdeE